MCAVPAGHTDVLRKLLYSGFFLFFFFPPLGAAGGTSDHPSRWWTGLQNSFRGFICTRHVCHWSENINVSMCLKAFALLKRGDETTRAGKHMQIRTTYCVCLVAVNFFFVFGCQCSHTHTHSAILCVWVDVCSERHWLRCVLTRQQQWLIAARLRGIMSSYEADRRRILRFSFIWILPTPDGSINALPSASLLAAVPRTLQSPSCTELFQFQNVITAYY